VIRCHCGCGVVTPRARAKYVNRAHQVAHWRVSGRFSAMARLGGKAGARTKQIRAIRNAAQKAGRALTASEAAIYRTAYQNGYSAGWQQARRDTRRGAA
jgi:hypothetical protein